MEAAIGLRDDFDAAGLRRLTRSANQGRQLLALAEIYDGGRRSCGADRRGEAADRAGLGRAVQ